MTNDLDELLAAAKNVKMTPEQSERQRRSFAYGNTHFENDKITRETVDRAAARLAAARKAAAKRCGTLKE